MRPSFLARPLLVGALALLQITPALAATDRADSDAASRWDFSHIYASDAEWKADYDRIGVVIDEMKALKGELANSPENVLRYFQLQDEGGISWRITGRMSGRVWRRISAR